MYGIRLSRDLDGMKWREFSALLAGLDHETPLGRVVAVRAEDDPKRLKDFTPQMRRVRAAWRSRKAKAMPQQKVDNFIEQMKQVFISMVGGEKHGE